MTGVMNGMWTGGGQGVWTKGVYTGVYEGLDMGLCEQGGGNTGWTCIFGTHSCTWLLDAVQAKCGTDLSCASIGALNGWVQVAT